MECAYCGKIDEKVKICGGCRSSLYCSRECQTKDWPRHKEICKKIKLCTTDSDKDVLKAVRGGQKQDFIDLEVTHNDKTFILKAPMQEFIQIRFGILPPTLIAEARNEFNQILPKIFNNEPLSMDTMGRFGQNALILHCAGDKRIKLKN